MKEKKKEFDNECIVTMFVEARPAPDASSDVDFILAQVHDQLNDA